MFDAGLGRDAARAASMLAAAGIETDLAFAASKPGKFFSYADRRGARFTVFLGRLIRTSVRKIFLIVDHLSAHEKATVMNWVGAHRDRIEVFFMPPYTPESNPDEYLNNDLKGNVHEAGLPEDREELRSRVQRFMRTLFSTPEHVMSYFQHPCVQYAAGT